MLEGAIEFAREGDEVDVPSELRPLLNFRKLPKTALDRVALAIHRDAAFREQLSQSLAATAVGAPAVVWLQAKPDWVSRLEAFLDDDRAGGASTPAGDTAEPAGALVDARALERKLRGAERAVARSEQQRAVIEAEAERQREQADELRKQVRVLQRERDAARRDARTLSAELDGLRAQLARVDHVAGRRDDERKRLRERVRELEQALQGPLNARDSRELQRLARAVAASARASAADAEALDRELAARLESRPRSGAAAGSGGAGPAAGPARPARRRPIRMPGGIVDDSVAGAEFLVSRPGAMLIVDGYNATLSSWPDLALDLQRDRLVSLLADLTARIGSLEAVVVFDGAEMGAPISRRRKSPVQVQFSPPHIEADDVVLAMVDDVPLERPVVVASNDRRVRDGARLAGANVISVHQLIALGR